MGRKNKVVSQQCGTVWHGELAVQTGINVFTFLHNPPHENSNSGRTCNHIVCAEESGVQCKELGRKDMVV